MLKHLQNWATAYFYVPISLLMIWVFAKFAYFLTGRRPTENVDWIVGMSENLVKLVFLVLFCEIIREQTGFWMTKQESMANTSLARTQVISKCVTLIVGAYILSH